MCSSDLATFADFGEVRVLGKKSVARMNRVHVRDFRRADDPVNPQVTFRSRGFADADRLVRELDVHGVRVHLGINRHRADVQFLARADDADGDFAAIGNQDFFKHGLLENERKIRSSRRTDFEQRLAEFHRFATFNQNLRDNAFDLGLDFIHHFHRFND